MNVLVRFAFVALALPSALLAEPVLHFNGSDTITRKLQALAPAIAAETGAKIEFSPNGVGNGIADLAAGRAEVAMVVGTVEYFARRLNEATPGSVDVAKFRLFRLPDQYAAPATIVVHPANPVTALTRNQIREIFVGQVTNWKQVGGPDLAIVPVVQQPMDGYFATLSVVIIHGEVAGPAIKRVAKSSDICAVVAQTPGAIGFLSNAVVAGEVARFPIEPALIPPSYLVTLGEPTGALKTVVDALLAKAQ